jgi:hypothetical protein
VIGYIWDSRGNKMTEVGTLWTVRMVQDCCRASLIWIFERSNLRNSSIGWAICKQKYTILAHTHRLIWYINTNSFRGWMTLSVLKKSKNQCRTLPPVRFISSYFVYISNGFHLHFVPVLFNHHLLESFQIQIDPSPDIPPSLRAVIVAYQFNFGRGYATIAKQPLLHYKAIKSLC